MHSAYTNHTIHLCTEKVYGGEMVRDATWACRQASIHIRSPFYRSSLRSPDLFILLLPFPLVACSLDRTTVLQRKLQQYECNTNIRSFPTISIFTRET